MKIDVKSNRYSFSLTIWHKVNLILGDSATGKTTLIRMIDNESPAVSKITSNGFTLEHLTYSNFKKYFSKIHSAHDRVLQSGRYISFDKFLDEYLSDELNLISTNSVIFIDDEDYIVTPEFAKYINRDTSNYFVLINRCHISKIGYSIDATFVLDFKDRHYTLKPYYDYMGDANSPDYFLVEGVGLDRCYFVRLFGESRILKSSCDKSGGRFYVIDVLKDNLAKLQGRTCMLLVDFSAFGSNFRAVVDFCEDNNINLCIDRAYHSFEYFLLGTNFINDIDIDAYIDSNILKYPTIEVLCTHRLNGITSGFYYSYNKSRSSTEDLLPCYVEDCCGKRNKGKYYDCSKLRDWNYSKVVNNIKGTSFEYLTSF